MWWYISFAVVLCITWYFFSTQKPKTKKIAPTIEWNREIDSSGVQVELLDYKNKEDFDNTVETYARSFCDDPAYKWIFQSTDLLHPLRWTKRQMLSMALPSKHIFVATQIINNKKSILGGATWIDPGAELSSLSFLTALLQIPFLFGFGPFSRMTSFALLLEHYHAKITGSKHVWYLQILGVHPDFQGRGIARKVMDPILKHADENGIECYLETTNSKNLPLYEHFGFVVRHHATTTPIFGGPGGWMMTREPKNAKKQ